MRENKTKQSEAIEKIESARQALLQINPTHESYTTLQKYFDHCRNNGKTLHEQLGNRCLQGLAVLKFLRDIVIKDNDRYLTSSLLPTKIPSNSDRYYSINDGSYILRYLRKQYYTQKEAIGSIETESNDFAIVKNSHRDFIRPLTAWQIHLLNDTIMKIIGNLRLLLTTSKSQAIVFHANKSWAVECTEEIGRQLLPEEYQGKIKNLPVQEQGFNRSLFHASASLNVY